MILYFTNYRYLFARLGISFLWIESFRNSSAGISGVTGADEQAGIMPQNPQEQVASLASAIQTHIPHIAFIRDSKGMI
ncbi:hypothetical protein [uncultured Nitrosomonas sp.]|uniref:hypothetical protein n=1 Tax=uncultured Nitrosomonas sp. TaxID=156424 RepID=UPI0025CE3CA9|nr:hypothetical protein [uncultured Nitrosomonas sp.]